MVELGYKKRALGWRFCVATSGLVAQRAAEVCGNLKWFVIKRNASRSHNGGLILLKKDTHLFFHHLI